MAEDNLINLTKQVKITLEKRSAPKIVTQVGVSFDISGSTQSYYGSGKGSYIQALVNRVFAIAVTFDDNEALNTWVFDDNNSQVPDIVSNNYEDYVNKHILLNRHISKWGLTKFKGIIKSINTYYLEPTSEETTIASKIISAFKFSKKKSEEVKTLPDPAFILFITDGIADDEEWAEAEIKRTQNERIFWQFAGIDAPNVEYRFLKKLQEKYPNVNFDIISPTRTTDEELYDKLISPKFVNWYTNLPK